MGSLRELIANAAIALGVIALPVVVWTVGIRGAGQDQARLVTEWIAPWVGGAAVGLLVLLIFRIRGLLVVPLTAEDAEPYNARIASTARIVAAIAIPVAIIVPAVLGSDIRIFACMAAGGLVAGLMPFQVYAAYRRFRASREQ